MPAQEQQFGPDQPDPIGTGRSRGGGLHRRGDVGDDRDPVGRGLQGRAKRADLDDSRRPARRSPARTSPGQGPCRGVRGQQRCDHRGIRCHEDLARRTIDRELGIDGQRLDGRPETQHERDTEGARDDRGVARRRAAAQRDRGHQVVP